MTEKYPFQDIEPKWQRYWEEHKLFRALDSDAKRKKLYVLDMFPYPSGAGLHVGHPEGYTATDIYCRYQRMRGFNVLHPMGWDAFGLPAEQYAIESGTHPALTTRKNIETFKRQIKRFGFSYDWEREINTTDPAYYKWTQWIFLKLYERRLAYMKNAPVWWCGFCGTVLANEEVVDGKCERKGHEVGRLQMRQWMLRITAYAERLLADLDSLDWPEHIKDQQRHWIGKSEGAFIDFKVAILINQNREGNLEASDSVVELGNKPFPLDSCRVFTTRPDTLFGATYVVIAPEHIWVDLFVTPDRKAAVEEYRKKCASKSDLERTDLAKEKTGVFTGAYAINPVNGEKIPVWIADYVLASYGTGAIMAVPAHDQRDFEFAKKYDLPIRPVIIPEGAQLAGPLDKAFEATGRMHNSGAFTGLRSEEAKGKIVAWLESRKLGEPQVIYKLRDWLFSRQRYWGEPIPIVHCKSKCKQPVPLPETLLPLKLPDMPDFKSGEIVQQGGGGQVGSQPGLTIGHTFEVKDFRVAPLEHAKNADGTPWKQTVCPKCGGPAERETNTMPQWAGSCWYYLRYLDPKNDKCAWDPAKERYWMPVDLYIGGAEHAVLHLLYARFWHKVLYDLKLVSTPEPFQQLINQGLILGEDGEKMSKSRGNVVNPDEVIDAHGADAFRLYEMFMGPLEAVKPWSTRSIEGVDRFLNRLWRLIVTDTGLNPQLQDVLVDGELKRLLHGTIKTVTADLEGLRLNTAISAMMILLNALTDAKPLPRAAAETLVLLLSPFAPHLCEELWARLGHRESLTYVPWPSFDASALAQTETLLVVQVNGKVRARITVPTEASETEVRAVILADERIKKFVNGQPIKQFIVVPKRLVNIVV